MSLCICMEVLTVIERIIFRTSTSNRNQGSNMLMTSIGIRVIIRTLLTVENHILSYPLPNNINFNYNKGFILSNII